MPDLTRTITINRPPEKVWRWFNGQQELRQWLRPDLQIDLRVGGTYRMLGEDEQTWISGEVLELVPARRLSLSWLEEGAGWQGPARLLIELQPAGRGTLVRLTHEGFEGIGVARWAEIAKNYEAGMDDHRVLERLAGLVEGG